MASAVSIVPNDQMETPHYSVLRVRKGRNADLSHMLPKLHEKKRWRCLLKEEYAERKRPERPALATFAMRILPPTPTPSNRRLASRHGERIMLPPRGLPAGSPILQPLPLTRWGNNCSAVKKRKPLKQPHRKRKKKRSVNRMSAARQNNRRDRNEHTETPDNRAGRIDGGEPRR